MQVLVEQSLIGWKEFELQGMRDLADHVVIIHCRDRGSCCAMGLCWAAGRLVASLC